MFPFLFLSIAKATDFHFNAFKIRFNKTYENEEENARRLNIFNQNLRRAAKLNRDQPYATFGVTKFMDLTPEEFAARYLSSTPNDFEFTSESVTAKSTNLKISESDYVDWVEAGMVSPVQDQGICGSCWAFSTVSAVESGYAINRGGTVPNLSKQQLVDCDRNNNGCRGGNLDKAMAYIVKNGLMTEEDYPYISRDTGMETCCQYKSNKAKKYIKSYKPLTKGDEDALVKAIKEGPIAVGIDATAIQYYTGGIITNNKNCSTTSVNKGVVAVGTGYDKEKNMDYYKIRNSWGPDWGEDGYFRLQYGKHVCAIGQWGVQPTY